LVERSEFRSIGDGRSWMISYDVANVVLVGCEVGLVVVPCGSSVVKNERL
jgi:hypothetical protein